MAKKEDNTQKEKLNVENKEENKHQILKEKPLKNLAFLEKHYRFIGLILFCVIYLIMLPKITPQILVEYKITSQDLIKMFGTISKLAIIGFGLIYFGIMNLFNKILIKWLHLKSAIINPIILGLGNLFGLWFSHDILFVESSYTELLRIMKLYIAKPLFSTTIIMIIISILWLMLLILIPRILVPKISGGQKNEQ